MVAAIVRKIPQIVKTRLYSQSFGISFFMSYTEVFIFKLHFP